MKYLARKSFVIIEAIFTLICGAAIIVICLLRQYLCVIPFVLLFSISLAWLIVDSATTISIKSDGIEYKRLRKSFILPYEEIKKCTIGAIHPNQAQFYSLEIIGKSGEEIVVLLDFHFKLIDIILEKIPTKKIVAQQSWGIRKCSKKFFNKVSPYLNSKERAKLRSF